MQSQDTVLIPLRARDGSVRAHAIVDAADAAWVNQWRWSISGGGKYAARGVTFAPGKRTTVYLHRVILNLEPGDLRIGDHINRNTLDCRRSNLRIVTKAENVQNQSPYKKAKSPYRGVWWNTQKRRWCAAVEYRGKTYYAGHFVDEHSAGEAARVLRARILPGAID